MRVDLSKADLEEIYYAVMLKASDIRDGVYDDSKGEVRRRLSETSSWAAHLDSILDKIARALWGQTVRR